MAAKKAKRPERPEPDAVELEIELEPADVEDDIGGPEVSEGDDWTDSDEPIDWDTLDTVIATDDGDDKPFDDTSDGTGSQDTTSLTEEVVVKLVAGHDTPPSPRTSSEDDEEEDNDDFADIRHREANEFVCTGCFLVLHERLRSPSDPSLCNDCY